MTDLCPGEAEPSGLAERLVAHPATDHERGCDGRCYSCSCGFNHKTDRLVLEAAARIKALEAESQNWRTEYLNAAKDAAELAGRVVVLETALELAADVRWAELAAGSPFTLIDRGLLGDLHSQASKAYRGAAET